MQDFKEKDFKKGFKKRDWCLTDYEMNNFNSLLGLVDEGVCSFVCVAKETCPTTKKEHIQGYVRFHHQKTFTAVKKLLGKAHFQGCLGNPEQNMNYCKGLVPKKGNVLNPSCEMRGKPPSQGKRSDLEDILFKCRQKGADYLSIINDNQQYELQYGRRIKEIIRDHIKPRNYETIGYWLFGTAGTRKTTTLMKLMPEAEFVEFDGKFYSEFKYSSKVLIFDDQFKGKDAEKRLCEADIKSLLNTKPHKLRILGGYQELIAQKIIFIENADWTAFFPKSKALERRFKSINTDQLLGPDGFVCPKLLRSSLGGNTKPPRQTSMNDFVVV